MTRVLKRAPRSRGEMATMDRVYSALNTCFRRRRMREFEQRMALTDGVSILDVGGTPAIWSFLSCQPKLTILNLRPSDTEDALEVVGDGTRLPFTDHCFDIVFSNSVIEHVGSAEKQRQFAEEIRRVGRRIYVETPNRWFPIDPHLLMPMIHLLPTNWQRRLVRNFTIWGLITRPSRDAVDSFIDTTKLLDATEMRQLFPQSHLDRERFAGLTKSLIAWGPGDSVETSARPASLGASGPGTAEAVGPTWGDGQTGP